MRRKFESNCVTKEEEEKPYNKLLFYTLFHLPVHVAYSQLVVISPELV